MQKQSSLIAVAFALAAISSPPASWARKPIQDLPVFCQVSEAVYRGGQPTEKGMEELKEKGVKTIVSLRNNRELTEREKTTAEKLGLRFVSLPLDGISKPSKAVIQKFLSIVKSPEAQPVYVHCEHGQDRTGTMIGIYRQDVDNWPPDKAYGEMVKRGFHPSYAWLADAVFDYAEDKGAPPSNSRPLGVKLYDHVSHMFAFVKI